LAGRRRREGAVGPTTAVTYHSLMTWRRQLFGRLSVARCCRVSRRSAAMPWRWQAMTRNWRVQASTNLWQRLP